MSAPDESGAAKTPLSARDEALWSEHIHGVLRDIAERHLRRESPTITFTPTDLVHEAYLRLSSLHMGFADRQHFVRLASTQMRRLLVEHARRKHSQKRGEGPIVVTLSHADASADTGGLRVIELDLLLTDLARADERKARIAELHYFGGFSQAETAEALDISEATVVRDLRFLRGWLAMQLDARVDPAAPA
ncbi:RNA polymerase subunit sigma-24 [Ahniella affigens]|uniref:RNA polymerase subunit sigma-24 n=1 Tax=Ahniella affigens TaxID=2021234 RepID=A0A2P1PUL9_9GAMM|nr:ECF-type sigma factor [Ahniella affigens]AVP98538.1 RNA polymerase subunit sigma-24 [Ahniella affigens]